MVIDAPTEERFEFLLSAFLAWCDHVTEGCVHSDSHFSLFTFAGQLQQPHGRPPCSVFDVTAHTVRYCRRVCFLFLLKGSIAKQDRLNLLSL